MLIYSSGCGITIGFVLVVVMMVMMVMVMYEIASVVLFCAVGLAFTLLHFVWRARCSAVIGAL
jgi:hypothetical protein